MSGFSDVTGVAHAPGSPLFHGPILSPGRRPGHPLYSRPTPPSWAVPLVLEPFPPGPSSLQGGPPRVKVRFPRGLGPSPDNAHIFLSELAELFPACLNSKQFFRSHLKKALDSVGPRAYMLVVSLVKVVSNPSGGDANG
ncbi:hypothetical protein DMR_01420 [Solidesulfovibrio magneticus RS-1]|uniref:Uncharacterized protein n=1 Tax=Solidesulfovibrio magneticus (strain ATCC 700980 / DSM 13731 / RS-1) TaxID=573370 RepID=C4XTW8_SOLM1|nr:hypothetical protein DMR_01420 [Solidesulfovibrio magneticus RS-1]